MKNFLVFAFLLGSFILAAESHKCWRCVDEDCDDPEVMRCSKNDTICVAYVENLYDEEKRSFSKGCTNQTALDRKCGEIARNYGKCFPCYKKELCNNLSLGTYLETMPSVRFIDWEKKCVVSGCKM